jgi:hypothetical protein
MITKLIDVGNEKEWQLCDWELVIPQDSMLHMTPQEIGELVIRLNGMIDETREEYNERKFGYSARPIYPLSTQHQRSKVGNHRARIYAQLVHRDGEFCQVPNCEGVNLQVDHIVPIAMGGTNEPENLQLLCGYHNRAKGVKSWDEFLNEVTS